jgi:HAD superfamily hydrolase (TIGR01509 family)
MDGLLVDSEPVWEEAETIVFLAHGIHIERHVREQLIGLRNDEFIGRLREIYRVTVSVETLQRKVIAHLLAIIPHKVKAKPGAPELLAYANHHNLPIAIASSSPVAIIEAIVKSQGWEAVVPIRCSAETVALGKPAPDVYLKAASLLGVAPRDCLALEDSPNGARAAVAAGMTCYAVPDGDLSKHTAFEGITEHRFDSLHHVLRELKLNASDH